jgi:glycerate kinase
VAGWAAPTPEMRVVAAPDKFRGSARAGEIAAAVCRAARAEGWDCSPVPMADGGEGTLEAFGGPNRKALVTGPLGDPVEAAWRFDGHTAVIEMSAASGLELVGGAELNDPLAATTYGTGELIDAAIDRGAERVIVGLGGSATTDGGLGALRALFPLQRIRGIELLVACDVRTRFVDAAQVFARQKGASEPQVELLTRRLERLVQVYRDDHGVDVADLPGGGAAGGLGGALAAIGGDLVPGFELVAEEVELADLVEGADLIITGEGMLDAESLDGKVVGGVLELAEEFGVPVCVVVGQIGPDIEVDFDVVSLAESFGSEPAWSDAAGCVERVVAERLKGYG